MLESCNSAEAHFSSSSALVPRYHVTVTYSSSLVVMYLNGVKIGSSSTMGVNVAQLGVVSRPYIGRSQYGVDFYLNAYLRDFRCYQSALRWV